MSIQQALEELKKYAQEFTQVGDAEQAIKSNKEDFLHKWAKIYQYYDYIIVHAEQMSDEWFTAIDIVSDISYDNPSLKEWIDMVVDPKKGKSQTQSQTKVTIDTSALSNAIDALTTEIKDMQHWDTEDIGDIQWQLQEYQKLLIANQSAFSPTAYQSLLNDIGAALDKISRFNNMLNSEAMQEIERMQV